MLRERHPRIELALIAEPRALSLAGREADVALRLARPNRDAGQAVRARRIGTLAYAAYAPSGCAADLPWLTYVAEMAALPQARWIADRVARGEAVAPLACNDAEAILQAVRAGCGRSLLPCVVGDAEPGLRRLATEAPPAREIWLLTHPSRRSLARVAAVTEWLHATVAALPGGRLSGGEG